LATARWVSSGRTTPSNISATRSTRCGNSIAAWLRRAGSCRKPPSTDGRGAFQDPTHVSFWNSNSFWYYTRADQNRFIDCPVRFQANRLKNFFTSEWHRELVYVKADLLKVVGRVPGGVAI
jgi:hypothetical protein